jgi:hypothetical protein
LAYAHGVTVAELDDRQIFRVDFDDGDIGLFVGAHHPGGKASAVSQFRLDFVRALDYVKVREDVTIRPDDETGPFALDRPSPPWVSALIVFVRRPLEKQVVKW